MHREGCAQALEDELWALRAELAEQSGYLGAETTQQLVQDLLHAGDSPGS